MKFEDIKPGMQVCTLNRPDVPFTVYEKREWLAPGGCVRRMIETNDQSTFFNVEIDNLIEYKAHEPERVPWTINDFEEFKDLWFMHKKAPLSYYRIIIVHQDGVSIRGSFYRYDEILEVFEIYPSGKPCGKLKESK